MGTAEERQLCTTLVVIFLLSCLEGRLSFFNLIFSVKSFISSYRRVMMEQEMRSIMLGCGVKVYSPLYLPPCSAVLERRF